MDRNRNGVKAHLKAFFQLWQPGGAAKPKNLCYPAWSENVLYDQLVRHGLLGVYAQKLKDLGYWQDCPSALREKISLGWNAQMTSNLQLARLQDDVVALHKREKIPFILLK